MAMRAVQQKLRMLIFNMSAKDSKFIQLRELQEQMRGINPKLSLYATIKAQYDKLLEELEGEEAPVPHSGRREMQTSSGAVMKFNIQVKTRNLCSHKHDKKTCDIPGCENTREGKKRCHACGQMKYRSFCRKHNVRDMPMQSFIEIGVDNAEK